MACYALFTFFYLIVSNFPSTTDAASAANLTVYFSPNGSTIWTNNNNSIQPVQLADDSFVRLVLYDNGDNHTLAYGCGFYCHHAWGGLCQFSILYLQNSITSLVGGIEPQVVWSANRDHLVGENAILEFSRGDLVLKDNDGMTVWTSNTSSQTETVTGMTLPSSLNLVLFDDGNQTVWQSFDHPTDALVTGQKLLLGQRLSSGPAPRGSTIGLFTLSITDDLLAASVHMGIAIPYMALGAGRGHWMKYASFENGVVRFGYHFGNNGFIYTNDLEETQWLRPSQFLRLDVDGDLRIYSWSSASGWSVAYAFMERKDPCMTPLRCGYYGVCSDGHCSCPRGIDGIEYFSLYDHEDPEMGCSQVGKFEAEGKYEMVDFGSLEFAYMDKESPGQGIQKLSDCKEACLLNASCKAVYFLQTNNSSNGRCHLNSNVLTIQKTPEAAQKLNVSSTYLKVRVRNPAPPPALFPTSPLSSSRRTRVDKNLALVVAVVAAPIVLVIAIIFAIALWRRRISGMKEDVVGRVLGVPTRFSYKDLCTATADFSEKVGQGGFGTVFRGVLSDGTPVAVKQLHSDGQGTGDFVEEVKTIGSIHHINLVQLIGYCTEKTHRLLVYEYMSNGSLDKWIFGSKKRELDWKTKVKIITDVAKGLAYLHEECRRSIAHLDMKPHNVLLDEKFNAKISDFGLAQVMDRDQSQMTPTLRGTLGYLAPEWQASEHITVKVDVYSFGIILLETLSGRKNLDYDQRDSRIRLLSFLLRKENDSRLIDIVQKPMEAMHFHDEEEEALRLIRIGLWCLNDDYKKRPSMSTVVKALEGGLELDGQINYEVSHTMIPSPNNGAVVSSPTD